MRQQAVEQGAAPVACGRMDDQSGRFVDDDDGIVFINDVQIHGFGCEREVFFARTYRNGNQFTAYHFIFGLRGLIVYNDCTLFNPRTQAAARVVGHEFGQYGIQPSARHFERNGQINTTFCFRG